MLNVVDTLKELVSRPSVNPMGQSVSGDIYLETKLTGYLEQLFNELGLPYECQEVDRGRHNIVTRIDGATSPENGGQLVLLESDDFREGTRAFQQRRTAKFTDS